jgi:hypothetical protein
MRIIFATTVLVATLSACGGGDSTESPKTSPDITMSVFKGQGGVQCAPGPFDMDAMQSQLVAANVEVRARSCGTDGLMYAAICGAPTSRIGIFDIPATQLAAARGAGFAPLSDLPQAKRVPCG